MAHDEDVGYKRPPKQTRFRKGQSGNPKGRPKHTRNLKTDLLEELNEEIPIREGTRICHITKQRAMVRSVMVKALKGDNRSIVTIFRLIERLLDLNDPGVPDQTLTTTEEQELLAVLEARLLQKARKRMSAPDTPHPPQAEDGGTHEA